MKIINHIFCFIFLIIMISCSEKQEQLEVEVYETSANGNKLTKINAISTSDSLINIKILKNKEYQILTGFGGAFTESSAYLLNRISKENRDIILIL